MTMLGRAATTKSTVQAPGETPGADQPIQVMIVDDSAVVRGLVSRWAVTEMLASALQRVPVVMAQHMPPIFTAILAGRLARATGREAKKAADGEPLKPATLYVAPGDRYMTVAFDEAPVVRLNDEPPVNFCRPAVDPLFASVAAAHGPAALGIILSGMGGDCAAGARAIADAGGSVIAQDEASSVVWGMPGAVAGAGACSALLPPALIAEGKLMRGERP